MKRKPIDKQLLKNWRHKMYDFTYEEIAAWTGLSKNTIGNTIRTGKGTQYTIDRISAFFTAQYSLA